MSKFEKLIQKILSLSDGLRFEELKKTLESIGYTMDASGGGSHRSFRKPNAPMITIPAHRSIKRTYVEMVAKAIKREMDEDENP